MDTEFLRFPFLQYSEKFDFGCVSVPMDIDELDSDYQFSNVSLPHDGIKFCDNRI